MNPVIFLRVHTPSSFLLDTFFPNVQTSDKEEIFFDVTDSKPHISPFVSPLLPGKVVDSGGYQTKSFKPAYVKDKRRFDANIPYIRFLKNLSKIDEFRSIIDLTHFTFIELHGGGNIDLWIKANYLSGTNIKCLYFRDRDTSTTPPSVVHPQKVIITSKREIENYIPISSIEEKFDVTFTPYEIEHWNDMDVANSLYNKGIRFGNDQKHSENVIKQILQGQNIWNQIILSPENRSEIQDWFQQMKDFFEDAGW